MRLRLLSLVVLALALGAQPVEAGYNPHLGAAPTLPSPGGAGKFAQSPAPRIVDVRAIAKRAPIPTPPPPCPPPEGQGIILLPEGEGNLR